MPTLPEAKAALRREMAAARKTLTKEERAALDTALTARCLALPEYRAAKVVAAYYSTAREVDTRRILADALAAGKTVALPRSEKASGAMRFYRIAALEQVVPGALKVPEPAPECPELALGEESLLLVPGYCFDRGGFRLGYGGGYFDRFLAGYRGLSLGLCYERFLLTALSTEATDRPVARILTEARLLAPPTAAPKEAL